MACHIYAAASGSAARRVKPGASPEELSSIENGVWMCYRHGKLIDTDECTYTPGQLADWRRLAERRAALRHALGREATAEDLASEPLASTTLRLTTPEFIEGISSTLEVSAVEIVWGRENAMALRDLLLEIARNALLHGKASHFEMTVKPHSIEISDNGEAFSLVDLENAQEPRGGAMALLQLAQRAPQILASYRRNDESNIVEFAFTHALGDLLALNPCSTSFYGAMQSVMEAMDFVRTHPECGTIFLRPQFGILSYSDLHNLANAIKSSDLAGRDIALVIEPHSDGIREFLRVEMPSIRLIEAPLRA